MPPRKMTPEQLEKLAAARAKANAVRSAMKQNREEEQINILQNKIDKIKGKKTPAKDIVPDKEVEPDNVNAPDKEVEPDNENVVTPEVTPEIEPDNVVTAKSPPPPPEPKCEEPAKEQKKKKSKKKPVIIMHNDSDSDSNTGSDDERSNVIYIRNSRRRPKEKAQPPPPPQPVEQPRQQVQMNPFFSPMYGMGHRNFN